MHIGKYYFGRARNFAIGFIWTKDGKVAFLFLGLCISNNWPGAKKENES